MVFEVQDTETSQTCMGAGTGECRYLTFRVRDDYGEGKDTLPTQVGRSGISSMR